MTKILKTRKRIRLEYRDYSRKGKYFITICVQNRESILGKIKEINNIELSNEGNIAEQGIKNIEKFYQNVKIDEYIIMPNHIHIILILNSENRIKISTIIKEYKTYVTKTLKYSIWQKSFHEHVIRNQKEYLIIKKYIQNNIKNWKNDKYLKIPTKTYDVGRISFARGNDKEITK